MDTNRCTPVYRPPIRNWTIGVIIFVINLKENKFGTTFIILKYNSS